ncbi:hypothetical protein [Chitinophaga vietnamensis]|uniref:hypothetical protein n=1 Tax=Chitinophaga vietnamensis TaxID=2593957 RepID=UPI0011788C59|nr:hypothetical protein [Chitinophaga vietnamensis]
MLPILTAPGYEQVYAIEAPRSARLHLQSTITSTDDKHNHTFHIQYNGDQFVILTSVSWHVAHACSVVFASLMISHVLASAAHNKYFYLLIIPFAILFNFVEEQVRSRLFKTYKKKILVNQSGIYLDRQYYPWEGIAGTFIVEHFKYRYYESFLVLALKNGSSVYVSMQNLNTVDMAKNKIATAITHFKPVI